MRLSHLIFAPLCFAALTAFASPVAPKEGADFTLLKSPQATQASDKKIEVIEFFMYHCPACYALESTVNEWVKKQGNNIVFRRVHLPLTGESDPEAHLFVTLEAMNLESSLHDKVLASWHIEHKRLTSDEDNTKWAAKNGLDKAKFLSFYNSFSVVSKLKSLPRNIANYGVNSTPTFVVNGRYLTNPAMIENANGNLPREQLAQATMQVLDGLIAKSRE